MVLSTRGPCFEGEGRPESRVDDSGTGIRFSVLL